MFLPFTSAIDV